MNSRVLGGIKASDEFLPNERENLRQRLWICQGETLDLRNILLGVLPRRSKHVLLLMDFQPHDPPCSVEFQSTFSLKHGVSVHAGYGDENFFFDQRSGVCAVQVFQGPAAATGLRQAKSYVGEFS